MVLTLLLNTFDAEGGYESAHQDHAHHCHICQGIHYGGNPHMFDAMQIIHDLWSRDMKYVREDGINRCWRKDKILLASWNTDTENEAVLASIPARDKNITDK